MPKRFTLSDADYEQLRKTVLQRDGWKCRACPSRSGLHCHHIVFRSHGGPDLSWNLVTLCDACHRSVHGLIRNKFIVILARSGNEDEIPNADAGLKFKHYPTLRKRNVWNL